MKKIKQPKGDRTPITIDEIREALDVIFNTPRPDPDRRVKLTIFCESVEEAKKTAEYFNNLFKEEFLNSLENLK